MSQHAGLFFPEREWPVEEDILHTVRALPVFLSHVTFPRYKGCFFVLLNLQSTPAFTLEKASQKQPAIVEKQTFF